VAKKKNELEEKNGELIISLQRLQAEFDNYRKREEQNKKQFLNTATISLIEKLIPVLDTFELAMKSSPEGPAKQGMEMIYTQLYTVLSDEGLEKIEPINEPFNPVEHEAIMVETGKGPEIIIEVFRPGYKLKDKIIRHSKVKIRRQQNQKDLEKSDVEENKNE